MIISTRNYHDLIEVVTASIDARDPYTAGHSQRVSNVVVEIAKNMDLAGSEIEKFHIAAHLHDIGKIGIRDDILLKKERLTPDEYEVIKQHSVIGYNILKRVEAFREIAIIVRHHHERWDGGGYPDGLSEETIPLGARIIAVADSLDAMTSERTYHPKRAWEEAIEECIRCSGSQFDPSIIEVLKSIGPELGYIAKKPALSVISWLDLAEV